MQMSAVGRAGVQRSMWCVLEVRKQPTACVTCKEGRHQQRREQAVDGADASWSADESHVQFPMFAKCTNDELAAAAWGRRPEAIAAEFSFVHIGVPLFTPPTPL